jgi:hypothetical protein
VAIFFTRITIQEIDKWNRSMVRGKFVLDVERLNLYKIFRFRVEHTQCKFVVYKDGKVFVKQIGKMTQEKFAKYKEEQKVILIALKMIFEVYRGKFNPKKFALTTVEPGRRISVNTATPDYLALPLIRACV